jgi:hypothetical protein
LTWSVSNDVFQVSIVGSNNTYPSFLSRFFSSCSLICIFPFHWSLKQNFWKLNIVEISILIQASYRVHLISRENLFNNVVEDWTIFVDWDFKNQFDVKINFRLRKFTNFSFLNWWETFHFKNWKLIVQLRIVFTWKFWFRNIFIWVHQFSSADELRTISIIKDWNLKTSLKTMKMISYWQLVMI